jgi:hypothetical protein
MWDLQSMPIDDQKRFLRTFWKQQAQSAYRQ